MLQSGSSAPLFSLPRLDGVDWRHERGKPALLVFFETDCPTCRLAIPYLNRLAQALDGKAEIVGISQDGDDSTRELIVQAPVKFTVVMDRDLSVSREYDPQAVPTLFLIDADGKVTRTSVAFDKAGLNAIAAEMCAAIGVEPFELAGGHDGAPDRKPGCVSRHLEPHQEVRGAGDPAASVNLYAERGPRASRIELEDGVDPYEFCYQAGFADPLPVIPPTAERVDRMLGATPLSAKLPPDQIVARVPPNYGMATVEKIAANAVMAGCRPEMMRVLIPLIRAACDERFNIHGVQATTHFAAPLVIVNGPIRRELGFACGGNVFSNVARANSTIGRAFQLILTNIGGARPGELDMSTLGNPGKFSYCIAENEEESPWDPLHTEFGFDRGQSALTLFAAEPPHGVSEHNAREGRVILKAISRALVTVFSYRFCFGWEAIVALCPEHVKTLHRSGFTKNSAREFLFENTGVPVKDYEEDGGEGTQFTQLYQRVTINGEECYRKFARPEQIRIVVVGGTAGKFSAVIGSWATGPRGSQMVCYPVD
ncbi:MAG TPA: TlpA disulfide reductase family protein [Blastocatellia bacterium]|nr:TlpA disulfide reductase family protein [Blastocatellia bacterium]